MCDARWVRFLSWAAPSAVEHSGKVPNNFERARAGDAMRSGEDEILASTTPLHPRLA
jgi:hypothetical protein